MVKKTKNQKGMEMLQVVMIIGIAVVIGAIILVGLKAITGTSNGAGGTGLLGRITNQVNNLFD
jgi:predicted anti-sigma-YlaC factor YlaD